MPVTATKPQTKSKTADKGGRVAHKGSKPPKPAAKPAEGKEGKPGAKSTYKTYPTVESVWCVQEKNANHYTPTTGKYWRGGPITVEDCKALLGWEELDADLDPDKLVALGVNMEVKKLCGKNVVMNKNQRNRFLVLDWLVTLRQEHLNDRWYLNGDSIVIGDMGNVLSGQNRMISLILAAYEWESGKRSAHWQAIRPKPLTMESLIVFGVSESDEVFRTLNAVLTATVAQVMFRSDYLKGRKASDRKHLGWIGEHAVKLLWHRTGVADDKQVGRLTNSEAMDFLRRHPRLMECVDFVWGSIGKGEVPGKIRAGYVAGLLYLMATSASDPNDYVQADAPNMRDESKLNFDNLDRGKDFWRALFKEKGTGPMADVRKALINMVGEATPDGEGYWGTSRINRVLAVLCRAWEGFLAGETLDAAYLRLKTYTNDEKVTKLVGTFTFGGIDEGVRFERKGAKAEAGGKGSEGKGDKGNGAASTKAGKPDKPAGTKGGKGGKGPKPIAAASKPTANGAEPAPTGKAGTKPEDNKLTNPGAAKGPDYIKQMMADLKKQHGDYILFFKRGSDNYQLWDSDAYTVGRLYSQIVQKNDDGMGKLLVAKDNLAKVLAALVKENHKAAECEWNDEIGKTMVTPLKMPKPEPKKKGLKPIARK